MVDIAARRLARAVERIELLETLIEDKTRELFLNGEALRVKSDALERLFDAVPGPVLALDSELKVTKFNRATLVLLQMAPLALHQRPARAFFPSVGEVVSRLPGSLGPVMTEVEWQLHQPMPMPVPVLVTASRFSDGDSEGFVIIATDLRERKALELELRQAHKLEGIGALATGVAHEVNTPLQFIGDNLEFLSEAVQVLTRYVESVEAQAPAASEQLLAEAEFEEVGFFKQRVPRSLQQAKDGVHRVTEIVRALKDFAHPGGQTAAPCDVGTIVRRAVALGASELKGVDVRLELESLPQVTGFESDLNQVFLNLLVNAGQAITSRGRGRGHVVVRAEVQGAELVVGVSDDGGGIPPHVQPRVFDPFFTTKPIGQGSGQGLSISRKLVVERHRGRLWFDTTPGQGTTFYLALPLAGVTT